MTETRFVLADIDGEELHVGWPRTDGVFGELSLARVTIAKGEVVKIEFVRKMTGEEIARLAAAPYMRWHALFSPVWGQPWALQLCRPNANAIARATSPVHTPGGDARRRVGV